MNNLFAVTYERWSDEDTEHGDTDDRGFEYENATLREAIQACGCGSYEANEYPIRAPRWFTTEYNHDYLTGVVEYRSLHIPEHVTPSSRRRIARLLGCHV